LGLEAEPAARPSWSPDGSLVAFTRPGFRGLWVMTPGGTSRQISDSPGVGFGYAWSPDGTAIATRTAREEGTQRVHALEVVSLDGAVRELTDERLEMAGLPRWVGTGHVALASRAGLEVVALGDDALLLDEPVALFSRGRLVIGEPSTGTTRSVGPTSAFNVTPSPDGQRVAFEVLGGNLFVSDLEGGNLVDLGPGGAPTWSPDGEWIAFAATQDDGHHITASDLIAVRTDGSARVTLTSTVDRLEVDPSWSPDGSRLAFVDLEDGALYALTLAQ
ncbi:TolB family protein, partial [Rubrivirga sp.]|uniref:TolB family protein n=1 Tax=Rubrivirga sp. TaxID=1885344 RepID=UPI003C7740AD